MEGKEKGEQKRERKGGNERTCQRWEKKGKGKCGKKRGLVPQLLLSGCAPASLGRGNRPSSRRSAIAKISLKARYGFRGRGRVRNMVR